MKRSNTVAAFFPSATTETYRTVFPLCVFLLGYKSY